MKREWKYNHLRAELELKLVTPDLENGKRPLRTEPDVSRPKAEGVEDSSRHLCQSRQAIGPHWQPDASRSDPWLPHGPGLPPESSFTTTLANYFNNAIVKKHLIEEINTPCPIKGIWGRMTNCVALPTKHIKDFNCSNRATWAFVVIWLNNSFISQ